MPSLLVNLWLLPPTYIRIDFWQFLQNFFFARAAKWHLTSASSPLHPHCTDKANGFVQNKTFSPNIWKWGLRSMFTRTVCGPGFIRALGGSSTYELTDIRLIWLHTHTFGCKWHEKLSNDTWSILEELPLPGMCLPNSQMACIYAAQT